MTAIAADFCLIENGKVWRVPELIHAAQQLKADHAGFLEITPLATADLVARMLIALLYAEQHQVPVIFNRTAQPLNLTTLASGFTIGLLTSGTTGQPKLISHPLADIMPKQLQPGKSSRWLLCYHPMSFAGLQVILQALFSGDTLIAASEADITGKAALALTQQITCLSLTPSMLRSMLMCWPTPPPLQRLTFGGEICDQRTLSLCRQWFPAAEIRHIYALTEAGVIFSVKDGKAGFPAEWLGQTFNGWTLSLQQQQLVLQRNEHALFTGDRLHIADARCYFIGRADNLINVAGHKVDIEQLEQRVLQLPAVQDARVYAKSSALTGAIIGVELISSDQPASRQALDQLNSSLPQAERMRLVQFVPQLTLSATGKKQRKMP